MCQVFVDALPDLPEHRRLPLFTQLATTIDVEQNLWLLVALMCEYILFPGNILISSFYHCHFVVINIVIMSLFNVPPLFLLYSYVDDIVVRKDCDFCLSLILPI